MKDILRDIGGRRFGRALIRLWLLAESTQDRAQTLSRWLHGLDFKATNALGEQFVAALESRNSTLPQNSSDNPLAMILALDRFCGQQADLPLHPAALPELEADGRRYWLIRRRNGGETPADRQSPNLEQWFRHFRVVPERVELGKASITVALVPLANPRRGPKPAAEPVRLRVSHFTDGATLELDEDLANERFHVTGLGDETTRRESVHKELAAVRASQADIWLAPELCVSPELRYAIASSLMDDYAEHLLLCVPGSFHEMDGAGRVNRAEIFDGDGVSVAAQDKLSQFSYARGKIILHEDIVVRRQITLLTTSIGLIGVAICKDYCDAATSALIQSAWDRLAPDWLLVPSMGDAATLKAHEARAVTHWKLRRTRSVIANQEPPEGLTAIPGFVCCNGKPAGIAVGGACHPEVDPDGRGSPPAVPRPRLKRIK